jgi:hypothetical protein
MPGSAYVRRGGLGIVVQSKEAFTWMPGRFQLDANGIDHITSEKWCPTEEKTT